VFTVLLLLFFPVRLANGFAIVAATLSQFGEGFFVDPRSLAISSRDNKSIGSLIGPWGILQI
jgi:hypothetical protein